MFNGLLTGTAGGTVERAFEAEFLRQQRDGLDVRLTIDPKIQAAAAKALGARKGAVVALDPRNGQVLAMVGYPTYDPGALSANGAALLPIPIRRCSTARHRASTRPVRRSRQSRPPPRSKTASSLQRRQSPARTPMSSMASQFRATT